MATTRIIAMHRNRGKSIAACLKARTDYAKNPDKTDGGALVSAYECDPRIVDSQFAFSKREYRDEMEKEFYQGGGKTAVAKGLPNSQPAPALDAKTIASLLASNPDLLMQVFKSVQFANPSPEN